MVTWQIQKNLYLHFHSTYGYQTWQGGNLLSEDLTYLVSWPVDNVVTWQIKKAYICTSTIPKATKLGRVVTYGWKIPPTKSCDLLITWSSDKWKILQLRFHKTCLPIWQSINLRLEEPTNQVMWSFDHVVTWKIKKIISAFQQHLW